MSAQAAPARRLRFIEVDRVARANVGARLRFTYPHGATRVGVVALRALSGGQKCVTVDGAMLGGEYAGIVRVERMGGNGRYADITPPPPEPVTHELVTRDDPKGVTAWCSCNPKTTWWGRTEQSATAGVRRHIDEQGQA